MPKTIDGFAPRPAVTAATPQQIAHKVTPPTPQHRTFAAPPKFQPRRRWWNRLVFPTIVVLCMCTSFLVQSLPIGMAVIAIYALVAWARRFSSRVSFVMAFLSLSTVVALLVVRQNADLASNFATYTFLFLVVGVVSSILESPAGKRHKRRTRL
ncbi:MAG TPA: hypothetical protein VLH38_04415 [Patescibacteria group bacterium]|nr:hypothetical protein [Patescibacteria group bacterium]